MSRVILNAFRNELEKIADAEDTLAKAVVGASLGGAATTILTSPITAAILYKWGPQAAAAFVTANTLKGVIAGGIGGALLDKKAAAWGEGSTRQSGWSSTAGGWATEFRSAGMGRQISSQSTNIARLRAPGPKSNTPGAGSPKPPSLPGAGPTKPAGMSMKQPKLQKPSIPKPAKAV
jgi:hypothetical protein